jgi:hypothetical protein
MLVFFALACIARESLRRDAAAESSILDMQVDEPEYVEETYKFDATVTDQVVGVGHFSETGSLQLSPALAVAGAAAGPTNGPIATHRVSEQLTGRLPQVQLPPTVQVPLPNTAELVEYVDLRGMTEHAGGVEGAMDRLTYEIANSLKERPTLVVWLFDNSQSLKARRDAIADRFDNVYKQLGVLKVGARGTLKTGIATYGAGTNFLTPEPVDDFNEAVEKVRGIRSDGGSSAENIFGAVAAVAGKWKSFRTRQGRNVMIIVVTDERGDDYQRMDDTIQLVKRHGMRVYCVGNAAIFGREHGFVQWVYEDGFSEELPVDQGPESAALESLQLAFWDGNRGLDRLSAGYGPYALTRLCTETGGMFFVADEPQGPKFDPGVMKAYHPDYIPLAEYQKNLGNNQAKASLVRAASVARADEIPEPVTYFPAPNDNELKQRITEAQKPMAVLDEKLRRMHAALTEGEAERPDLTEPRWRAGFDLAMGRMLAMRVRAFGYNSVLAQMKVSPVPFQQQGSNTWQLVLSHEIIAGPQVETLAEQAKQYLERVVAEHPGTPWALLAQHELEVPLGWEWRETYDPLSDRQIRAPSSQDVQVMLAQQQQQIRNMQQPQGPARQKPNL